MTIQIPTEEPTQQSLKEDHGIVCFGYDDVNKVTPFKLTGKEMGKKETLSLGERGDEFMLQRRSAGGNLRPTPPYEWRYHAKTGIVTKWKKEPDFDSCVNRGVYAEIAVDNEWMLHPPEDTFTQEDLEQVGIETFGMAVGPPETDGVVPFPSSGKDPFVRQARNAYVKGKNVTQWRLYSRGGSVTEWEANTGYDVALSTGRVGRINAAKHGFRFTTK